MAEFDEQKHEGTSRRYAQNTRRIVTYKGEMDRADGKKQATEVLPPPHVMSPLRSKASFGSARDMLSPATTPMFHKVSSRQVGPRYKGFAIK